MQMVKILAWNFINLVTLPRHPPFFFLRADLCLESSLALRTTPRVADGQSNKADWILLLSILMGPFAAVELNVLQLSDSCLIF